MVQVLGTLLMWETQTKPPVPGFSLAQPHRSPREQEAWSGRSLLHLSSAAALPGSRQGRLPCTWLDVLLFPSLSCLVLPLRFYLGMLLLSFDRQTGTKC